eukprot:s10_g6.t1
MCRSTLETLITDFLETPDDFGAFSAQQIVATLRRLCDPLTWEFLCKDAVPSKPSFQDLPSIENACIDFRFQADSFETIPRSWGKERVVLHAFAGRRRQGDIQFYLDRLQLQFPEGVLIHTASVDIIYDVALGDVSCKQTQLFWFDAIDKQFIIGFVGGPPCETWSKARAVQLLDAPHAPRVVRSSDFLWGFECLRVKELMQILVGNDLLTFTIMCLLRLARVNGVGLMEHPADPDTEEAASVWRLPVIFLLQQLPGFELISVSQGLLGAPTPKPTSLLCLNLPGLASDLRQHFVSKDLPLRSSIGKLGDGTFATSRLKEYPPAMCMSIARTFDFVIRAEPIVEQERQLNEFLNLCAPLFVQSFGTHFGQDYAG